MFSTLITLILCIWLDLSTSSLSRAFLHRSVMSPFLLLTFTESGFKLHSYLWKLKLIWKSWLSCYSPYPSSGSPSGPIIFYNQG